MHAHLDRHEFFQLVCRHLDDVGALLENDDSSYRTLFIGRHENDEEQRTVTEEEIQLWVGSTLRQRARGLYIVEREPEVDRRKRIDISVSAAGVGTIPIEIKPIGGPTTIRDRLAGQYMATKERTHGILLLVRVSKRADGWNIDGKKKQSLSDLFAALRSHAKAVAEELDRTIIVTAIDVEASRKES